MRDKQHNVPGNSMEYIIGRYLIFTRKSYPHLVESFPQMLSYMIYGWAEKMASFLGPHGELLKSFILFHISDDNLMMSILR